MLKLLELFTLHVEIIIQELLFIFHYCILHFDELEQDVATGEKLTTHGRNNKMQGKKKTE